MNDYEYDWCSKNIVLSFCLPTFLLNLGQNANSLKVVYLDFFGLNHLELVHDQRVRGI